MSAHAIDSATTLTHERHSMEIGSAYALQVCLLQIPAMVLVTHIFSLSRDTMLHHAFTWVFSSHEGLRSNSLIVAAD